MDSSTEQRLTVKDVKSRTEDKEMDLSMMGISKIPIKEMVSLQLQLPFFLMNYGHVFFIWRRKKYFFSKIIKKNIC